MPNVFGGWARRSTSAFSATIWSRASRSVEASRSFWAGQLAHLGPQPGQLLGVDPAAPPAQPVGLGLKACDLLAQRPFGPSRFVVIGHRRHLPFLAVHLPTLTRPPGTSLADPPLAARTHAPVSPSRCGAAHGRWSFRMTRERR